MQFVPRVINFALDAQFSTHILLNASIIDAGLLIELIL